MSNSEIRQLALEAKKAARVMANVPQDIKNNLLNRMAEALEAGMAELLPANEKDIIAGREKGLSSAMLDRLVLSEKRVADMASCLREVATLPDPVGEITGFKIRPNGIRVGRECASPWGSSALFTNPVPTSPQTPPPCASKAATP